MAPNMDRDLPMEGGNPIFSAIAEIVSLLMRDPTTDWDKVNIGVLQQHLADMHHLFLDADVTAQWVANDLSMRINPGGRAGEAASRMVHAR